MAWTISSIVLAMKTSGFQCNAPLERLHSRGNGYQPRSSQPRKTSHSPRRSRASGAHALWLRIDRSRPVSSTMAGSPRAGCAKVGTGFSHEIPLSSLGIDQVHDFGPIRSKIIVIEEPDCPAFHGNLELRPGFGMSSTAV